MSRPSESFLSLIRAAQTIQSRARFETFIADKRGQMPGPQHPHVGLLVGMRVQEFQNWLLDENVNWKLTDAQLLAVMRLEFPQARGQVFTADVDAGLRLLAGIRAHYNRDGHNGKSPRSRGLPLSISYGQFEPTQGSAPTTPKNAGRLTVTVRRIGPLQTSPKGHPYIECHTDAGIVACWGSANDRANIDRISTALLPAAIECVFVESNWSRHALWIPRWITASRMWCDYRWLPPASPFSLNRQAQPALYPTQIFRSGDRRSCASFGPLSRATLQRQHPTVSAHALVNYRAQACSHATSLRSCEPSRR